MAMPPSGGQKGSHVQKHQDAGEVRVAWIPDILSGVQLALVESSERPLASMSPTVRICRPPAPHFLKHHFTLARYCLVQSALGLRRNNSSVGEHMVGYVRVLPIAWRGMPVEHLALCTWQVLKKE